MNSLLSFSISLIVFTVITIQLTSSASFPNPPQFPPPNASADEWALFWKLLHNYYAIIARPRFGKRYDSVLSHAKDPSLLTVINPNSASSSSSSEHDLNAILRENDHNLDDDQQSNINKLYRFINTNPERRR